MSSRRLLFAALCIAGPLLVARAFSRPVGNRRVPQPAKAVDLARYIGRWYELGRYENRFERHCEGVTADYALREDGLLQIVNTCHRDAPDGAAHAARGRAKVVAGSRNAKLKVSFFGPFYLGNYWVLDHADDYSWSIVGEPSGKYLWMLSRNPVPSAQARIALIERVATLGYDTRLIRPTMQHAVASAKRMPRVAATLSQKRT